VFNHFVSTIGLPTIAWWKNHEGPEREKIREEALAKLSPRERRILGIEAK
jgi:hypothetical protein